MAANRGQHPRHAHRGALRRFFIWQETAYESDNLCAGSGFETDTDANGLADGWTLYTAGTTSGVTVARESDVPAAGLWSQYISANALGATGGDRIGIWQRIDLGADKSGQPLTISTRVRGDKPSKSTVYAIVRDAGLASLATVSQTDNTSSRYKWQYIEATTAAMPAGARYVDFYIWQEQGDGGSSFMGIDTAKVQLGVPTPAATLLADDLISVGGQLLMVAENVEGGVDGVMTVPLVNRIRKTITSGAAVTWNRPTVDMLCLQSPAIAWSGATRGVRMETISPRTRRVRARLSAAP